MWENDACEIVFGAGNWLQAIFFLFLIKILKNLKKMCKNKGIGSAL